MLAVHMKQESLQQPAFIVGGIIGAILVLVLIFRPNGLLGSSVSQKA